MCLIRFGSKASAAPEPSTAAPRPFIMTTPATMYQPSSSLPAGAVVQTVSPRRSGSSRSKGYYIDSGGRRRSFSVTRDASGRASYVVEDGTGRRTAYVDRRTTPPPAGSSPPPARASQVIVIEQRSPRGSGAHLSQPASPTRGLGLTDLTFPPDAEPGSRKVVRRGASRSPRASRASLQSRGSAGPAGLSPPPARDLASPSSPRRRRESGGSSRRPSVSRHRVPGGYELRASNGDVVRVETCAPSPRASGTGLGMARVRSEGGYGMARTASGGSARAMNGLGMVRTVSGGPAAAWMGGQGMARTPSGGVVMARAPSGGNGLPRTNGQGMARTPSGGVVMARTPSGGAGMARAPSGGGGGTPRTPGLSNPPLSPSAAAAAATTTLRATVVYERPDRPPVTASPGPLPPLSPALFTPPLSPPLSAPPLAAAARTSPGGAPMTRTASAGAAQRAPSGVRGHARSASASGPRASGVGPGRRREGRERIVVVDGHGTWRGYNR